MIEGIIKHSGQPTKLTYPIVWLKLVETLGIYSVSHTMLGGINISERETLAIEKYKVIKTKSTYIIFSCRTD